MAFELLPSALWAAAEPLLPAPKPPGTPGRPPVGNRAALTGILYVMHTGCPWRLVPAELGCGSGVTCWRRLRAWTRLGVWPKLHRLLLEELARHGRLEQARAVIDSASVRAEKGARTPAPTPPTAPRRAANAT